MTWEPQTEAEADDPLLRAEAFRRAWPHALSRAMRAAADLLAAVERISQSQTVHQMRLEELGSKMPGALKAAEDRLATSTSHAVSAIEKSAEETLDAIASISAQVQDDMQRCTNEARLEGQKQATEQAALHQAFAQSAADVLSQMTKQISSLEQFKQQIITERKALEQERLQPGFWKSLLSNGIKRISS